MSSRASTTAGRKRKTARTRGATTSRSGKATAANPGAPKRKGAARTPKRKAPPPRKAAPAARSGIARIVRPRNLVLVLVLAIALGAGYRFWLRDSSLVAATHVQVIGAEGPEAARVERALQGSAEGMSTLDVDHGALEAAIAGFPTVAGIGVEANFPHGITITVDSRPPVLMLDAGAREVPLAGDGTVLSGVTPDHHLPRISSDRAPSGAKVNGVTLQEAIITGAAPDPLRKLIDKVQVKKDKGVVITAAGLPLIFGNSDRADEKWTAVAATLADPKLDALTYLDVRVPDRPAAGGAGETIADAPDSIATPPAEAVVAPSEPTTTTIDPAATAPATTPITPDPTATAPAVADPAATGEPAATTAPADSAGDAGGGVSPTGGVAP